MVCLAGKPPLALWEVVKIHPEFLYLYRTSELTNIALVNDVSPTTAGASAVSALVWLSGYVIAVLDVLEGEEVGGPLAFKNCCGPIRVV